MALETNLLLCPLLIFISSLCPCLATLPILLMGPIPLLRLLPLLHVLPPYFVGFHSIPNLKFLASRGSPSEKSGWGIGVEWVRFFGGRRVGIVTGRGLGVLIRTPWEDPGPVFSAGGHQLPPAQGGSRFWVGAEKRASIPAWRHPSPTRLLQPPQPFTLS